MSAEDPSVWCHPVDRNRDRFRKGKEEYSYSVRNRPQSEAPIGGRVQRPWRTLWPCSWGVNSSSPSVVNLKQLRVLLFPSRREIKSKIFHPARIEGKSLIVSSSRDKIRVESTPALKNCWLHPSLLYRTQITKPPIDFRSSFLFFFFPLYFVGWAVCLFGLPCAVVGGRDRIFHVSRFWFPVFDSLGSSFRFLGISKTMATTTTGLRIRKVLHPICLLVVHGRQVLRSNFRRRRHQFQQSQHPLQPRHELRQKLHGQS